MRRCDYETTGTEEYLYRGWDEKHEHAYPQMRAIQRDYLYSLVLFYAVMFCPQSQLVYHNICLTLSRHYRASL